MAASTTTMLFVWAAPAFVDGSPVDHTWVTNFDNQKYKYPDVAAVVAAKKCYWLCSRNQHLLDEAARLLGKEKFEKVFGFPAKERINLVDPSLPDDNKQD
jgi:hypothetical protein